MGRVSQLRHSGLPSESIQWTMAIILVLNNQNFGGGNGNLINKFRRKSTGIHKLSQFTSAASLFIEISFFILMLKSEQLLSNFFICNARSDYINSHNNHYKEMTCV